MIASLVFNSWLLIEEETVNSPTPPEKSAGLPAGRPGQGAQQRLFPGGSPGNRGGAGPAQGAGSHLPVSQPHFRGPFQPSV